MKRNEVTAERLHEKKFVGIHDFGLDQCARALKRGDKYEVNWANNYQYQVVTMYARDGFKSGAMWRKLTQPETEWLRNGGLRPCPDGVLNSCGD